MQPQAPTQAPAATNSQQALSQLQGFQSQMKAPQDMLSGQEQQLGVPGAQQQVSGLRQAITNTTNLLNQVAPSVYGRTQGSLVTDAQAARQIGNEQAPLNTQLNTENQQYGGANADLTNLLGRASTMAGLEQTGQQTQLSNLENIYKDLYGKEQDTAAQQLEQQKLAEAKRQFDLTPRGGGGLGDLFSPTSSDTPPGGNGQQNYQLKNPKDPSQGFNFTNQYGNPINAFQYAQATKTPFTQLLQIMARAGDKGAQSGLQFIGDNGNADPTKVRDQNTANLYKALTGKSVGIYKGQPIYAEYGRGGGKKIVGYK